MKGEDGGKTHEAEKHTRDAERNGHPAGNKGQVLPVLNHQPGRKRNGVDDRRRGNDARCRLRRSG